MDKTTPRSQELFIFAASILLPGALLAYVWFVLAPPSTGEMRLNPTAAVEVPDTRQMGEAFIGARVALWSEDEYEPWVVAKGQEELPPADLPPPVPSVPQPSTPLPVPGPRLEHTGSLPRWGEFPAREEVLVDDEM